MAELVDAPDGFGKDCVIGACIGGSIPQELKDSIAQDCIPHRFLGRSDLKVELTHHEIPL